MPRGNAPQVDCDSVIGRIRWGVPIASPPDVGRRYGQWEIVAKRPGGHRTVRCGSCCRIAVVSVTTLRAGKTTQCKSCARREPRGRSAEFDALIPDRDVQRKWIDIHKHALRRCNNQKSEQWRNYGWRGIRVADEFHDRETFFRYAMTLPGWDDLSLSLDRIDNDRGYERGNLRMATPYEQVVNRRPRERWSPINVESAP